MPLNPTPALPAGFVAEAELGSPGGVRVVRARRGGESYLLRLDPDGRGTEGLAELAVLSAVEHPCIAGLVDHGPLSGGGRYLARRWIEGTDLQRWACDRPAEEIGRLVARLCPALDHLHRLGFVHADLKPENVVVEAGERPILCDFGLARRAGAAQGDTVSGTLFSIAPEVLLGQPVTARADLFALGALLHRLLAPSGRSAREFYALFPNASFLDAAGTALESLPEWSRDLIAALTARDPERRPRSALEVGRALAERLDVELETGEIVEELRFPVGFGREAWLESWLRAERDGTDHDAAWLRVPPGEEPRSLWSHVRLVASLRGRPNRGLDLTHELSGIESELGLHAWAGELARSEEGWLVALVETDGAWTRLALETLARTLALADDEPRRLIVVSDLAPFDATDWSPADVPPVDEAEVRRFCDRNLPDESAERRALLAERLAGTTVGSATRLDGVLRELSRHGDLTAHGGTFRLRPGPVPEPGSFAAVASVGAPATDPSDVELFLALDVADGRATPEALAAITQREAEEVGLALVRLSAQGSLALERTPEGLEARGRPGTTPIADGSARRDLHLCRADFLESTGAAVHEVLLHRFSGARDASRRDRSGSELVTELASLRERGRAELALDALERLRRHAASSNIELAEVTPALLLEHARAWCSVGRTDRALLVLEELVDGAGPELEAELELIRGRVASLRHETEHAFEHLERAVELDPGTLTAATEGRIELLHSLGRDEEVCAIVAGFHPREREESGALAGRQRAYLESLAAMSAHRLGRADEARTQLESLVAEAGYLDDPGLEAALRLDVAIVERGSGSLERAREELETCVRLYDRAGLVAGLAHARATLGGLLRELGELADSEQFLESALETRARLGDTEGAGTARGMLGMVQFDRGHARAAIETLARTARAMSGGQRRRHAPLLEALADEMRTRIGEKPAGTEEADVADPRILTSRARVRWLADDIEGARDLARRSVELALSLKLERLAGEAHALGSRLEGRDPEPSDERTLAADDERLFLLLAEKGERFDREAADAFAAELERRGRDDRAARLWTAVGARSEDRRRAEHAASRAAGCFDRCRAGLTEEEAAALRLNLLGIPDPWPGDFAPRADLSQEELDMEVATVLDINSLLVHQRDLDSLLGVIVEHALRVTGAERGFLVLEEHGDLRFDTALDSSRGDIAQPELEISGSVVREALEVMRPIRVSNAVDDPLLGHLSSVVSLELRSILCVPIAIADGLRGAIYVDHRLRTGAFDERAEKLCTLLASQAALSIQQVRRLEEIRNLNRALERRVVEQESDLRSARRALVEAGGAHPVRGLMGQSRPMEEARELLRRTAPSDLPVLVMGESGTGKELAARSLHELSHRAEKPFVSESCAALPANLIESELFGYLRGAFTGAERDRAGLFEEAHGGTLFLDEVGELPLELQAKLLRVLETGEVRRLGDAQPREVDFRLVVATNRDLELEVREGRFRQDLYYRLAGIHVRMPSLAERPEDVALLTKHFLSQESERGGVERRASRAVLAALSRRSWPGNVRELRNEIARLCVLFEGDLDDPSIVSTPAVFESAALSGGVVPMAEVERRTILQAIEAAGGDKRRAATLLGISRAKIYQRLKEWKEGSEADGES